MRVAGVLLQEVLPNIDESARAAIISELVDKSFGLLDEAFESRRARFAKAYCRDVSKFSLNT
jgi:hypothetical protein